MRENPKCSYFSKDATVYIVTIDILDEMMLALTYVGRLNLSVQIKKIKTEANRNLATIKWC